MKYYCAKCTKIVIDPEIPRCDICGNIYELIYDYPNRLHLQELISNSPIRHWKYHDLMPLDYHNTPKIVTMGEGGTPLIEHNRLKMKLNGNKLEENSLFISRLFFKYEASNPTGSFKDRASALETTLALNDNKNTIVVASTGNMGASITTYAAFAGLKCIVFLTDDKHTNKYRQMIDAGAIIKIVPGTYVNAMIAAEKYYLEHKETTYLAGDYGIRVEGTKSVGYEIFEQLGEVPDYIIVPVGNGILLWAIYKAFQDLQDIFETKIPKIIGVRPIDSINTRIAAVSCPKPNAEFMIKRIAHKIIELSDNEVFVTKDQLSENGIFVESAGVMSYAALDYLSLEGNVVCIASGHGLKEI